MFCGIVSYVGWELLRLLYSGGSISLVIYNKLLCQSQYINNSIPYSDVSATQSKATFDTNRWQRKKILFWYICFVFFRQNWNNSLYILVYQPKCLKPFLFAYFCCYAIIRIRFDRFCWLSQNSEDVVLPRPFYCISYRIMFTLPHIFQEKLCLFIWNGWEMRKRKNDLKRTLKIVSTLC